MDYTGCRTLSIYNTPEDMARKVDEYFDTCFKPVLDKETGEYRMKEIKPPTYSGVARYLGFSSRQQFLNYKNDDARGFDEVIADAKMRIEDYLEGKLVYSKAPTGIMFSLKNNAEWEDKTKRELSSDEKKPLVFGWVGDNSDVIDVAAEDKKELPTGVGGALSVSTSDSEVVGV